MERNRSQDFFSELDNTRIDDFGSFGFGRFDTIMACSAGSSTLLRSGEHATEPESAVLTAELEAIISTDVGVGETLKIEAAAGSGKSTALRVYAERRKELCILYLTFTAAEAQEKQVDYARRGLRHVVVSTLHARAFDATYPLHKGVISNTLSLPAGSVAKLTTTSTMDWPPARLAALHRVIERFLASDASQPGQQHMEGEAAPGGLLFAAQAVWQAAREGALPLTHDMYLKLCCDSPKLRASMFCGVDLVLLDEAHDCTEAQISLVEAQSGRRWASIMVMDFRQRIYGWRRAASEAYLRALPAVAVRRLSFTWRFGGVLAKLVSALLSHHVGAEASTAVVGSDTRHTQIREVPSPPFREVCGVGRRLTVVARTRKSLFQTAISAILSGAVDRISFSGEDPAAAYSMFGGRDRLLDTFALSMGRSRHDMLEPQHGAARFVEWGFSAYRSAAIAGDWREAVEACAAVVQYGAALPQLLRKLDVALRSKSCREVLLKTVHNAKGGEWPFVYAHADLGRSLSCADGMYRLNLVYVAMTRASAVLFIPSVIMSSWLGELDTGSSVQHARY